MSGETLRIFTAVDAHMLFRSVLQAWEPITKRLCPCPVLCGAVCGVFMTPLFTVGIKGLTTHAYDISLHHRATTAHDDLQCC